MPVLLIEMLLEAMYRFCDAHGEEEYEIFYTHGDHLGSANWITDYKGMPIQYLHYLPYGQLLANQQATGYDERYKFTGKERDEETGYDYFGARYYMPLLYHWTKVDPLVDDYLHISPYAYCNWNPVKFVDPTGEWVAVTSNDDSGTSYKIVGGTVDVGDCNVYVVGNDYDMDRDGKPQGATVLGQTVTPYSFSSYNKETKKDEFAIGSIINMYDKSGDSFIARFQNDEVPLTGYILPPILSNESGWPSGGCDFKYGDDQNRGMPLTILGGKIGTARDIGNFAAGFLAASKGFTGKTTRKVFDVFQNLTTPGCTTGEPPVSWWAQQLGHDYGRAARFANRVCQPNIYNAYH